MNIANLIGTSTSPALEAVYGQKKKNDSDDAQNGVYSWREDTVSLSEAALALAQMAGKEQAPPDDESQESLNGQTSGKDALQSGNAGENEDEGAVSGAGQGSAFGGGSGASASEIEAKIKQLQQKIVETQNSSLPEDTKSAMISSLQAQISELVQEKSALENQADKAA